MRTTRRIDHEAPKAAKSLAESERTHVGTAVSRLARKGPAPRTAGGTDHGFPVFEVPSGARPLTLERVRQALEDD